MPNCRLDYFLLPDKGFVECQHTHENVDDVSKFKQSTLKTYTTKQLILTATKIKQICFYLGSDIDQSWFCTARSEEEGARSTKGGGGVGTPVSSERVGVEEEAAAGRAAATRRRWRCRAAGRLRRRSQSN